jgi:anti-sigma regulatory factor (Ser/Thr protein kinase)
MLEAPRSRARGRLTNPGRDLPCGMSCLSNVRPAVQAATTQALTGGHKPMTETVVALDQRMIQFVLPSIPQSVRMARFHVRTALGLHKLGEYADNAEIITSELVANAIQHVADNPLETVGVTLARVRYPVAVAIVVTDSSPEGPIRRETSATSERGRGLQVVEALSIRWGWHRESGGKAIFAVIAREE